MVLVLCNSKGNKLSNLAHAVVYLSAMPHAISASVLPSHVHVASATMMNNVFLACSYFVPNHSDVRNQRLYFTYNVKITNNSSNTMQLLNRYWTITNAHGAKQEVRYVIQLGLLLSHNGIHSHP